MRRPLAELGSGRRLLWLILAAGLVLVFFPLVRQSVSSRSADQRAASAGLNIDQKNRRIDFKARVVKDQAWVQQLIYLAGYEWLRPESAIVSEVSLFELQQALALLDWRLWDKLWYGPDSEFKGYPVTVDIFVQYDHGKIPAEQLVSSQDELEPGELIFFGSPYFDHIVGDERGRRECARCPLLALEKKAVGESLTRGSGTCGYQLNFPASLKPGSQVTIVLELR